MKTVTIQIGNSDDKLTQKQWHDFVQTMHELIDAYADVVHFFGASANYEMWQNAAWVITVSEHLFQKLRADVVGLRGQYKQGSVAWTEGETQFI